MPPFPLPTLFGKSAPTIDIVDIGAMQIGTTPPFYKPLMDAGLARVVGFEPLKAECDRLNAMGRKNHTYLPHFIGDGTERTFHQTNTGYTSSLYEPNRVLVDRFQSLGDVMQTVATSKVQTRRLDDLDEVARFDFMKIDVQGAELDVLRGAERKLGGALVVETEVEFVPLYSGQPLFAEVDQAMRARGFMLHSFSGLAGRTLKPIYMAANPAGMIRQVLWSDAIYIPDLSRWAQLEPEQLLKLALILHEVYGSYDFAALAIQHHDAKTGKDLWKWYMQRLLGGTAIPEKPSL